MKRISKFSVSMKSLFCLLCIIWCGLELAADEQQILNLVPGWNWVGFYVLPDNKTVNNVLGAGTFSVNDFIKSKENMAGFNGAFWESFSVDYGALYQLYTSKATTVQISGHTSNNSLPVVSGWNWISNPTSEPVSAAELTHSGGWSAKDRIQGPDGMVTYSGEMWVPSAGFVLEPGKGYQLYVANGGNVTFPGGETPAEDLYLVVDLSGGPSASSYPMRYTNQGPDLSDDTCRTTELWLRKIPKGTFTMGSQSSESGRETDENEHEVNLLQDYYIGVFECTQKQWELVMGSNPSNFQGVTRPVDQVTYYNIRGRSPSAIGGWPTYGHYTDGQSFMSKLQAKAGLLFDLPTEAEWEYACRAGTTSPLNSGSSNSTDLNAIGRYSSNVSEGTGGYLSGHTEVGSYQPNAWGLYDMHGNVQEWCLDWYQNSYVAETDDPNGPAIGTQRVLRGGAYNSAYKLCRSASRNKSGGDSKSQTNGFRVCCHAVSSSEQDWIPMTSLYVVVDISAGTTATNYPVRFSDTAPNLASDTCRTTEIWLRYIPAGTFVMGPNVEDDQVYVYNDYSSKRHTVTLTRGFYMGVFECTQKQWELIMGTNPSTYSGACRPVETVSYNSIRGTKSIGGGGWPTYGHTVDSLSFMGVLSQKTGLVFDLPTDAEWEYACRAGTGTSFNSGKNLLVTGSFVDANMSEVGRYNKNQTDGKGGYSQHTKVGCYKVNRWGLYDMHGNVWELCLDWWNKLTSSAVTDPTGGGSSDPYYRVSRGGAWAQDAQSCRSPIRSSADPSATKNYVGFRISCQAVRPSSMTIGY